MKKIWFFDFLYIKVEYIINRKGNRSLEIVMNERTTVTITYEDVFNFASVKNKDKNTIKVNNLKINGVREKTIF